MMQAPELFKDVNGSVLSCIHMLLPDAAAYACSVCCKARPYPPRSQHSCMLPAARRRTASPVLAPGLIQTHEGVL